MSPDAQEKYAGACTGRGTTPAAILPWTPPSHDLHVVRLNGPWDCNALHTEWEQLARQARPRNPFVSPGWVTLWWQHLRRASPIFRDEFNFHCLRDGQGRLVAVIPLMQTRFPGYGPAAMRLFQFIGTDPSLTEFRGPLCRPEDHAVVVQALASHFSRRADDWDVFRWNGLRHEASAFDEADLPKFIPRGAVPDYIIEMPSDWREIDKRISSNTRKTLRKARESLAQAGLATTLRVIEHPSDVGGAADRFFALHTARATAKGMTRRPDKFAAPHIQAFLRDYLALSARAGELRVFELEIDGQIVATRLCFLLGTDLYLYFGGYDAELKEHGIMTVLTTEIFKWAITHGVARINLSTGRDHSKLRWKPAEIMLNNAVQISPTPRGRLALRLFRTYEAASRMRDQFGP